MFVLRAVLLFMTWCAFSGLFDAFHLSLGLLSSLAVSAMSEVLPVSRPSIRWSQFGRQAWCLGGYLVWLLWQVFVANVEVLRISLSRSIEEHLSPQFVEFETQLDGDFARFLLAHSITLTPGTVTVRVQGRHFVVHALTEGMALGTPGAMEERLVKIFGTSAKDVHAS